MGLHGPAPFPQRHFDIKRVEDMVGGYALVADRPATMRMRNPHEHLERPLSDTESAVLASVAGSALTVAAGVLTVCEQLDNSVWRTGSGGSGIRAVGPCRGVTAQAHRRWGRQSSMIRLEQLCANDQINLGVRGCRGSLDRGSTAAAANNAALSRDKFGETSSSRASPIAPWSLGAGCRGHRLPAACHYAAVGGRS